MGISKSVDIKFIFFFPKTYFAYSKVCKVFLANKYPAPYTYPIIVENSKYLKSYSVGSLLFNFLPTHFLCP